MLKMEPGWVMGGTILSATSGSLRYCRTGRATASGVEQLPGPCRLLATRKDEAPGAVDFSSNSEGFKWSGRQDLNLRPLGPEAPRAVVDGVAPGLLASHPVEVTEDTASAG